MQRMTIPTLRLLGEMLKNPTEEHYGLEIGRAAGIASGSLYPMLSRLEDLGWITGRWEGQEALDEGRRPRKYYRLTPLGEREALEAIQKIGLAPLVPKPANLFRFFWRLP